MNQDTFIQRLANHIQSHYNLANEELTVVFPNKRAAFYLRNAFKTNTQQTIWMPQMISIEEAVTQWSGITMADNIELLFELIDIDAQLHQNQEYKSDFSIFGSQAAQMIKDFDEIDKYGVDAAHVFNYVKENKRLEFWNFDEEKSKEKELKYLSFFSSLHQYYVKLWESLLAQKKGYYGMITRQLSGMPENELVDIIGNRKIIFAGFNALTTTEERIINTLIRNGKAEILFDYDAYYVDDENNEAGLFARKYKKHHAQWLENGISDALTTKPKTIHIISASGNTLQAKALQANLQESEDNDLAIILSDEHLLIPVLNAIPNKEIFKDFKVSMGYPITKTPVNQLVNDYFALRRRGKIRRKTMVNDAEQVVEVWYIWPILHLMDLEIVKITFPITEIAAFNQWKNDQIKGGKFIFETKDLEGLAQTPNIQRFLKTLLFDSIDNTPISLLHSVSQILSFLAHIIQSQQEEEKAYFLLNQISEIGKTINRLTQIIERNSNYVNDIQSVEVLYRLLSANTSVKLNSSSTEGLQIMGLLETRNLDFKHLHVLSVNEGILPAEKSQHSFIPQYIRRECGLPSYSEAQAVIAYHFYRLLQNGTDIYLYYNNLGENSGGEASRFILQIKHELSKNGNIEILEESYNSVAKSSLETKALTAEKTDILERLHNQIEGKGLSPSALSTYINCPLKYYLRYIAKINDNSIDEEVGVNDIGTVIHKTLQFLFEPYRPQDGKPQLIDKALFDNVIQSQWESKLKAAINDRFPNGFSDVGFNYLNMVTIKQQLRNYLQYTSKHLENNELIILKTEDRLETVLTTPKINCRFYGDTDRIDQFGGVIRVIDYKTGKVENANLKVPVRHQNDSDLEYLKQIPEKALQLLLYKYLYLKGDPTLSPDQVTAAIHGLKYANAIEFGLTKAVPSKNDTDADTTFLENGSFIYDMETMLEAVVSEMLDTTIPFAQTEDEKKCKHCEFKLICKR